MLKSASRRFEKERLRLLVNSATVEIVVLVSSFVRVRKKLDVLLVYWDAFEIAVEALYLVRFWK